MVQERLYDLIACLKQAVKGKIQTVGAVEGEDDALGAFGSHQIGELLPAPLDDRRPLDRGAIRPPSNRRAKAAVVVVYCRVNAFGLREAGRRVVEVNTSHV